MTEPDGLPADEVRRQKTLPSREAEQTRSIGLQKLCEQKGMSLLSLAERSGTGLTRLQAIYLGRWTPTPKERDAIAEVLDTPSSDIAWDHNTAVEHFYGPG